MKKNLNDFDNSDDKLDEETPYSYEEYCKKFKSGEKIKIDKKATKLISLVGGCIIVIILGYFFVMGLDVQEDSTKIVKVEENSEIILKEVVDKGIALQLNDIKINKNKLIIKMTLDYSNIDSSFIKDKENKFEMSTMGYFEIFVGDEKLKTFSPSIESNFLENKTIITVKIDLNTEIGLTTPVRLEYSCDKLEMIYSSSKNNVINGDWNLSYQINNLTDIEQGEIINIKQKSLLDKEKVDLEVNLDYIVSNNGTMELVYRYKNNNNNKLNENYNLEVKVTNSYGIDIANFKSALSDSQEMVKRKVPLNLEENINEITIIPRVTKKTFLTESKIVIEGNPIKIKINN